MSEHVDDLTFERLTLHELGERERAAALSHIHACGKCAAIYKVLLHVDEGARAAKLIPSRGVRWWPGVVVAVALAAGVVLWVQRSEEPSVVRGPGRASLALLAPVGDVRVPVELAWAPTTATKYRIDVFTREGLLVWSRTAMTSSIAWPADVPAPVGDYQWLVTALDGNVIVVESAVGSFRIVL